MESMGTGETRLLQLANHVIAVSKKCVAENITASPTLKKRSKIRVHVARIALMTVTSKLAPTATIRVDRVVRTAFTVILSVSFVLCCLDLIKHMQVYEGGDNSAPYELEIVYHRFVWLVLIFAAILLSAFQKYPTILAILVTLLASEYVSLRMYSRVIGHEFHKVSA
jgi:hypothetical protein